jgi:hypothetical protein
MLMGRAARGRRARQCPLWLEMDLMAPLSKMVSPAQMTAFPERKEE